MLLPQAPGTLQGMKNPVIPALVILITLLAGVPLAYARAVTAPTGAAAEPVTEATAPDPSTAVPEVFAPATAGELPRAPEAVAPAFVAPTLAPWVTPTLLGKARFEALEDDARLPDSKSGFRVTLLEIGARGTLADAVFYRIKLDAAVEVTPLDFWVEYRPSAALGLRAGQFKAPFGRQEIAHTGELALPDRAGIAAIAPGRDIGVMLHGSVAGRLGYAYGVFNGEGRNLSRNINNAFLHVGRLTWTPLGTPVDETEITAFRPAGLTLGLNAGLNYNGDIQNAETRLVGGDVSAYLDRMGVSGEYLLARVKAPAAAGFASFDKRGFYVQPIFAAVTDRWEFVLRYERYDLNTAGATVKEQEIEAGWIGTNLYFDGGREKLQLAYGKVAELEGVEYHNNTAVLQLQVRLE